MKLGDINFANVKPLSTYPEQRAKLLELCAKVEKSWDHEDAACALADHVRGILEDEAFATSDEQNTRAPDGQGL